MIRVAFYVRDDRSGWRLGDKDYLTRFKDITELTTSARAEVPAEEVNILEELPQGMVAPKDGWVLSFTCGALEPIYIAAWPDDIEHGR